MHELGIIGEVARIVERTMATNNLTKVKIVVLQSEQGISLCTGFHVFPPLDSQKPMCMLVDGFVMILLTNNEGIMAS